MNVKMPNKIRNRGIAGRSIRFKRRWRGYRPEEVIVAPGALAKELVRSGFAEDVTEENGDPDIVPEHEEAVPEHEEGMSEKEVSDEVNVVDDEVVTDKGKKSKRK